MVSRMDTADVAGDQRTPICYIGDVRLDHWENPERAVLEAREGNKVYLRGADPCDPESERIPVFEGDQIIVMEHLAYISLHTTTEGTGGYLLPLRIVPVREEPGRVVGRTLRYGEPDDGRRIHVRPGNSVQIESIQLQIDYVDEWEGQGVTGYVPLTPVLYTWMCFGTHHSDDKRRYLLSAARRLDQAQALFERIGELRQTDPEGAPAVRRAIFNLIGMTELALVALHRTIVMCADAQSDLGTTVAVPELIKLWRKGLEEIRNAYEHIEERAIGNVHGNPSPEALTIFDHDRIVADNVIAYGGYELDLATDVPDLIAVARQYLKDVAAEALPVTRESQNLGP